MNDHSNNEGNNNSEPSSQQNNSYRAERTSQQPYNESNDYIQQSQQAHQYAAAADSNVQQAQPQQNYTNFQQQPNYQQQNPNYYQQPGYGQYPPPPNINGYPYPVTRKTNTKSIISLILGCLSIIIPYLGFFIGIAGIIVSSLSLKELKSQLEDGKGLAVSGLVTAIVGTVIWGIVLIILLIALLAFANFSDNYYYY